MTPHAPQRGERPAASIKGSFDQGMKASYVARIAT
jgi:hypothetical protein